MPSAYIIANVDVTNPPPFDPTPPGADAIQMNGVGGTTATSEQSVAASDESVDATASVPVTTAEAPASSEAPATPAPSGP